MVRILWNLAYWFLVAALAFIGVRGGPKLLPGDKPWQEIALPWLQAYGFAAVCLAAAAVLATIPITKWFLDRRHARDLQRQVRQNLTPGAFRETDAADALRYLLRESAWSWRKYAHLNSLEMVDGLQLAEFERAALSGEIVTVGYSSEAGRVVVIDRRHWVGGRIEASTAMVPHGVTMATSRAAYSRSTFSQLAMASIDLEQVWPRAGVARRAWPRFWVWFKKKWWGSRLSNWLERRARRKG